MCLGERSFTDRYFDCADFSLTLGDLWLRRRDGSWELKCPVSSGRSPENRAESLCTRYREVTDLAQIQAEVLRVLKRDPGPAGEASRTSGQDKREDETWLEDLRLVCFAEFTTVRCSYTLGGGAQGVRVDLDQADFGYSVGEIEVLLSEGDDMQSAQQTIQRTAEKLGRSSLNTTSSFHWLLSNSNNSGHFIPAKATGTTFYMFYKL